MRNTEKLGTHYSSNVPILPVDIKDKMENKTSSGRSRNCFEGFSLFCKLLLLSIGEHLFKLQPMLIQSPKFLL